MIDFSKDFYYDETSPTFIRHSRDKWCGRDYSRLVVSKGSFAGCIDSQGYGSVKFNGKSVKIHKVVLSLFGFYLEPPNNVDHKDGNRSNNSINNLRIVSAGENSRNKKIRETNTSGYTGVSFTHNGTGCHYCTANGLI